MLGSPLNGGSVLAALPYPGLPVLTKLASTEPVAERCRYGAGPGPLPRTQYRRYERMSRETPRFFGHASGDGLRTA